MRWTAVFTLLCIACIALTPLAAAQDETYEVRLHRPAKLGTRSSFSFTGDLLQQVTVVANGQRQKQDPLRIGLKLNGILDVTLVDERGRETALKCTVADGSVLKDGKEIEKLDQGAVILAEAREKETLIRLEKGELSPAAKDALAIAFALKKGAGPNDDQLYGVAARQKVGASWPINVDLLAKELSQQGLGVRKEHVTGEVKLVSVEPVGGEPCLNLLVALQVHGFTSPVPPAMQGFKGGPGSVKTTLSAVYPVDPAQPRRSENESTTIFLLVGGPGGVLVETDIRKTREVRYAPAP